MNNVDAKTAPKTYAKPELTVYGKFAEVTASGNSRGSETGNQGAKKFP